MAIADKEAAHGLFTFHRGAPKVEDASGTDAQVPAWSGYLNRASLTGLQGRTHPHLRKTGCYIDDWCNGSTIGFEPVGGGSKPSLSAR